MMSTALRSFWAEPAVADAPRRVWRDWVLLGVLFTALIIEFLVRGELPWKWFSLLLSGGVVVTLLWRRTQPLIVAVVGFSLQTVTDIAEAFDAPDSAVMFVTACVLIIPYALGRWGSGRHIVAGLGFILACHAIREFINDTALVESLLQTLFWLFPAGLGGTVRLLAILRVREVDQVKDDERRMLARELHDTVAHHVSAIALQAELGLELSAGNPGTAPEIVTALESIASEASRSLQEMRVTVAALRSDERASYRPQEGIKDLHAMAQAWSDGPPVAVELAGDLDDVSPTVDAAIYRLVQESVTNAMRHAVNASAITVQVHGKPEKVTMRVRDDGEHVSSSNNSPGFGIVGMTERARLLDGVLEINNQLGTGWTVTAELPRKATIE